MRLNECSVCDLKRLIDRGEINPGEIIDDVLAAIDEKEPGINAYLEVFVDDLSRESRRLKQAKTPSKPFEGIPIAVKDNIAVEGKRLTCASRILAGYRSPYDATVVARLKAHGFVVCGRTNMDEFAMGSSTENSAFGPTMNPHDRSRVPGGSSGGSAAAVAACTAVAALGSDTGGSIRQPASFCGVVGLKPTYGRVSRYGLVAFASSMDQVGPIARTVEDASLILSLVAGPDDRDARTSASRFEHDPKGLKQGLEDLTIGVPRSFFTGEVDEAVGGSFDELLLELEKEKVSVREIDLPHLRYAVAAYYVIADAEASSNLARFDGVKYGYRAQGCAKASSMTAKTRSEAFGEEVKRRILLGAFVLSRGYYDRYYLQAEKVRALIARDFTEAFHACDLVMLPTSPTPAFEAGKKKDDPLKMYMSDVFTVPANLAGLPAVSVPFGEHEGLPLGVQFVGRPLEEDMVLRGAYAIESMAQGRSKNTA
jgi:aspartyl-tRNA(Asn)/glutamyl-tRNA(Gln) amidotransferase subunit A